MINLHVKYVNYGWTSESAKSLVHKYKISLKGQISSQNVSFYLRIRFNISDPNYGTHLPQINGVFLYFIVLTDANANL